MDQKETTVEVRTYFKNIFKKNNEDNDDIMKILVLLN